ncbi:MAG: UDP-N-acetylmuramoyl-tripeptide--D-alanyl-D-alanine ligase [Acidimicrobiales bacterium]|jgi:UDP-N-acetylmuramoyl-tripeptide--D-alanyl-D-alanine ligase
MRLSASVVAEASGGVLHGPGATVDGASVDSRSIAAGQLFVPIVAARNGHGFIADALAAGAAAYLTSEAPVGGTAIVVGDTTGALWELGALARTLLSDRIIGITGSVGKTTVKDLVAGGIGTRLRTHATRASYNNELGVPLTLLGAPDGVEAVVVEMGARFPGDIARLRELVRPAIGVITSIGSAHLEHLGGRGGIEQEKGSLIEGLPESGFAVLNDADCGTDLRARTDATVVTFGTTSGDVRAQILGRDAELRPTIRIDSPWGAGETTLAVRGDHQAANAAAAVATAVCAGVGFDDVLVGVGSAAGTQLRAEFWQTPSGLRVLNDSYNANPDSVEAALHNLAMVEAPRRVAVLGEMAELGASTEEAHRRMGALAESLGIEVVSVGVAEYGGTVVDDQAEALAVVAALPVDSVVLVKASRSVGLDRLAEVLRSEG